uniref:Uncharacterized protein n=1 Tax=Physcomitrium patens TaxID=3218 RepID=A0A2K1JV56_PHYPA|nr:hypothetical protein PHYPA_015184 [Physcomitrium patens]
MKSEFLPECSTMGLAQAHLLVASFVVESLEADLGLISANIFESSSTRFQGVGGRHIGR